MSRKRYTAEQIIGTLWEAEVPLSAGEAVGTVCRASGISEQSCATSCSMVRTSMHCRKRTCSSNAHAHHNTVEPHSSLGYKPPASAATLPTAIGSPYPEIGQTLSQQLDC